MDNWTCDLDFDSQFCTVFSAHDDRLSKRASKCSTNFHPEFIFWVEISEVDPVLGLVFYGAGSEAIFSLVIKIDLY